MTTTTPRETYRHGDLRQALLSAALEMAREGGPDAVVLREATRRAGVSPNAAYRHFADRNALLQAVSGAAQALVADHMTREIDAVRAVEPSGSAAVAHLRAVGFGYVGFARAEPGLFRAAFCIPEDLEASGDPTHAGTAGLTPFQLLGRALDELVESGALPQERRPHAELLAWSAVHGLSMLIIDGPLRNFPSEVLDGATTSVIDMVERGL
jgi:AcrR family transcriptional regulator